MDKETLKLIDKLANEISENRAKIIDDFVKAYVASREDYSKNPAAVIKRLKLIERIDSPTKRTYWCELKTGKLKSLTPSK